MPQLTGGRRRGFGLRALAVAGVAAVAVTAAPPAASAAPSPAAAGSNLGGGAPVHVMTPGTAVAARSDRRPVGGGVYDPVAGQTYITYGGHQEDNYIQAYDHRSGTWSAPVLIGDGGADSHNYPTIILADDGHILVFRSLHNTELRMARSVQPHSITGGWTDTVIPEGVGATYPMPFKTTNGTIFVFIRETVHDFDKSYPVDFRPMKYVRSTDNGLTWQTSAAASGQKWNIAPQDRPDNMNEVYIGQLRYEPATMLHPERVGIVYTLAGGGPEGHLHDRYHKNLYYTWFTPSDLHFHAADGRDLGATIDNAAQEKYLKIADTALQTVNPRSPDYISLVGTTLGYAPFVLWMTIDADGHLHDWSAVYTPFVGWLKRQLATGVRVRDMEPVSPVSWRVYGTPEDPTLPNVYTYQLWAGTLWQAEATIPTRQAVQRVDVIGDYRDPARIIAMGNSSDRNVAVADGDVYVAGR